MHKFINSAECVVPENIHTPTSEGLWKFRGGGAKLLKGKYEPKLEFPEGGDLNQKNPLWGRY